MAGPEERQFAAQNVDGQHIVGKKIVADFAERELGGLLHATNHLAVVGMGQKEGGEGFSITGPDTPDP